MFPQGDTTAPKSRGLVFPEGDVADPNVQRATDGLASSVFDHFSGAVRADSCFFRRRAKKNPRRETTGSDSRRAPEAWCSRKGTPQAQRAEAWFSRTGTL